MTPSTLFLTLFACGRGPSLTVYAPDEAVAELARGLVSPLGDAEVIVSTSPEDDARRGRRQSLALSGGLDCVECYSLEQSGVGSRSSLVTTASWGCSTPWPRPWSAAG
jgi:hypothetical protein